MLMKFKCLVNNISIRDYLLSFHLGKSNIYKLFLANLVLVNDKLVKENYILKLNDIIFIKPYSNDLTPYDYNLDILYEDDYILIINKPYGYIVHGDINSCDNMVANYFLNKGLNIKVRHVHRLDRETTGILVYAKDILTEAYFNYHLANHDFKRYYLAVCKGYVKANQTINKKIAKDRHNSNKYLVLNSGKDAITHIEVVKANKSYSILKILLETGRTHQIRVHLKYINHPLLNDPIYNPGEGKMALESYLFTFIHPYNLKEITIKCKINQELRWYFEK